MLLRIGSKSHSVKIFICFKMSEIFLAIVWRSRVNHPTSLTEKVTDIHASTCTNIPNREIIIKFLKSSLKTNQLENMKVTFDFIRILHLILLIVLTIVFGQILIQRYDWTSLTAYGLTCSIVCQINNVFLKFQDISASLSVVEEKNKSSDKSFKRKKTR